MHRTAVLIVLATTAAACGGDDDGSGDGTTEPDLAVESAGPHGVGFRRAVTTDPASARTFPLYIWYPTATPSGTFPVEEMLPEPDRATYAGLLAAADPGCPTRTAHATVDAAPAADSFPVIGFSHCHECTGFSATSIAERLASHGFIVVSAEHTGNTLWNQLAGDGLPLDTATLDLRVGDLAWAITQARTASQVPAWTDLAAVADLDPAHTGVFGHSFGSVTAGMYAQRYDVGAAFGLAAPMQNPLLPGVDVPTLDVPLGFLVAVEDNSITELGNNLIRSNFTSAPLESWKIEVADAGHWSVSDVVGVVDGFAPGCGMGERQTDGQPFTYLDAATGRGIAASYVTAFFRYTLQGHAGAAVYLATARPEGTVTVETRAP